MEKVYDDVTGLLSVSYQSVMTWDLLHQHMPICLLAVGLKLIKSSVLVRARKMTSGLPKPPRPPFSLTIAKTKDETEACYDIRIEGKRLPLFGISV